MSHHYRLEQKAMHALQAASGQAADATPYYQDRLARAIAEKRATFRGDLHELCRALKGAFPRDVVRQLGIQRTSMTRVSPSAARPSRLDQKLPEPHPVDYDWRFDEATANTLAQMAMEQHSVLCIGTPTVYDAIVERGGSANLIDQNPLLVRGLTQTDRCHFFIDDIVAVLPHDRRIGSRFACAVLDPPWYPRVYEQWLARTIPFLERGGVIFLVLFRELTRPEAAEERADLLGRLAAIGSLSFPDLDAVYVTPPFEAEVLDRNGLRPLPSWRAGDVVRIDLFPHIDCWPFRLQYVRPLKKWHRFVVGDQVVAIAVRQSDRGAITYVPPPPGNSFEIDSVSDRDPRREKISVWTSRNRAATATGTSRLATIFRLSTNSFEEPDGDQLTGSDRNVARRLAADLGFSF